MERSEEQDALNALAHKLDPQGRLVRAWQLEGGVSAHVSAFELERSDGRIERLVVRRHGPADQARDPHIAAHEFELLRFLDSEGMPVPTPRYLDVDGEVFGTPCLVVDYVDGEPAPRDGGRERFIDQFVAVLARIHRIDASTDDLSFLASRALSEVQSPATSADEQRLRAILQSASALPQRNRPVLLHGDFWPGNTLWRDGRLTAVIDWEDAAIGDPLADVANARLELLWALGAEAMEDFTRRYASTMSEIDMTDLPYWDLWADLRLAGRVSEWSLEESAERAMRAGHEAFVSQALDRIANAAAEKSSLDPESADYATELTKRLRAILGASLVGVYLHGSAVLGDFSRRRSDIDVLAVSARPLSAEEQSAVREQLSSASLPCPATGLEFHIVRLDTLSEVGGAPPFEVHLSTESRAGRDRLVDGHGREGDPDLVMHYAVLQQHGIALSGPFASEVFPEIPRELLLRAFVGELQWATDHASPTYQVLNACRVWLFLEEGGICSKVEGGEWAWSRLTEPEVVDLAIRNHRGRRPNPTLRLLELSCGTFCLDSRTLGSRTGDDETHTKNPRGTARAF
jgi:aminoglycoside phosphotransferase (APT) family kinase protein